MSAAAAPELTNDEKKELYERTSNAIMANDVDTINALIPQLKTIEEDLSVSLPTESRGIPKNPVLHAIHYNANDVLRALIDAGANINTIETTYAVDARGIQRSHTPTTFSPLRYAVLRGNDVAARMLFEHHPLYADDRIYVRHYLYMRRGHAYRGNANHYKNMLKELFKKLEEDSVSLVETFRYIVQYRNELDDENPTMLYFSLVYIYKEFLKVIGRIKNPLPYFTILFEDFYPSDEIAANMGLPNNDPDKQNLEYDDSKLYAYILLLATIQKVRYPLPILTYVFENGIDPNTQNHEGETVLFPFTRAMEVSETVDERVTLIKGLIDLGVNPYLPNGAGETPAVRAIKRGLPKPVIDALNPRSLDMIHELRETNPYIVERIAQKFTKKHLRNTPKSYAALLNKALENNDTRNNARIAFRPANLPNIYGRTGKVYARLKENQLRHEAESKPAGLSEGGQQQRSIASRKQRRQWQKRQANLKRTRRHPLKATKPL